MFSKFLEKVKQEPIIFMFRKMWEFRGDLAKTMLVMWFLAICARLTWLLQPLVFGLFLNEVQKGIGENLDYSLMLLGGLFTVGMVGWFFHGPSRVIERSIGFKVDGNYKKYLYNAVMSLPLTWHTDHDSGNTIDRVNKATDSVHAFSRSTFQITYMVMRAFGSLGILFYFNMYVAWIAAFFMVLAIAVLVKFDKILIPQYKLINDFESKAQAKVFDALSNVTTVKVLSIENPVLESLRIAWYASYKDYMKNKTLVEWKWFSGGTLVDFLIIVPLVVHVIYTHSIGSVIMVGTISTMYLYLRDLGSVYQTVASTYDEIAIQKSRVLGVKEIDDEYKKISKVKKKNFKGWESLRIENLKFKYDENLESHSLDIEDLEIRKGEKIALIGESGSGKSTILKVLHGMYESASANVEVGGKNFKTNFVDMNLHSTLVPQEPEVFSASIKENITLLLNFSDTEIERATKMAEFYEVAEGLLKGLDSVVNEKGVNLSGGQKQRLALSRALLFSAEKEIILLDESTSSVDPVNEVKIYKNIFENFPGVTILASIHKMNLLKYFDRIIILENGKIKIQGTFDYLLVHDAEFRLAWDEFVKENT